MRLQPGTMFAGYAIERQLGAGGMGVVYLARHPRLDRLVALKVLNDAFAKDDKARARFEREAALITALDHPNIVPIYDRNSPGDDVLWISMKYVEGGDAAALLAREGGRLSAEQAVRMITDAGQALDHAHGYGVVHRDVKPANLLVEKGIRGPLRTVVSDFGIARSLEDSETGSRVSATLAYAAPERFGGGPVDHRADIYSLGCTLFKLLTGEPPYPRSDDAAVIAAHLHSPPPRPRDFRADLPSGLDVVLATVLAKRPDARYPDCATFSAAARDAVERSGETVAGLPITADPDELSETRDSPVWFGHEAETAPSPHGRREPPAPLYPSRSDLPFAQPSRTPAPGQPVTPAHPFTPASGQPFTPAPSGRQDVRSPYAGRSGPPSPQAGQSSAPSPHAGRPGTPPPYPLGPRGTPAPAEPPAPQLITRRRLLIGGAAALALGAATATTLALTSRDAKDSGDSTGGGTATATPTELALGTQIMALAFSPDATLAVGGKDNTTQFWNVHTGEQTSDPLTGHTNSIRAVAFNPDGTLLATASEDSTARLWDLATHAPIGNPLTAHTNMIRSVAFSPDGTLLATGSEDTTAQLWTVATRQPYVAALTGHTGAVRTLAFHPDGALLATGSADATARLWHTASGASSGFPLAGHNGSIRTLAFTPDGSLLATGGDDATIHLWDMTTHKLSGTPLSGHSEPILAVAFSPDSGVMATGSRDGTIRLWDMATRVAIGNPLTGHTAAVHAVAFTPDGTLLATGSADQTLRLWTIADYR
ncbi:WD40 repeat domain-containing serine/threonine protein kinase [Nocardia sp. IFM 10818]